MGVLRAAVVFTGSLCVCTAFLAAAPAAQHVRAAIQQQNSAALFSSRPPTEFVDVGFIETDIDTAKDGLPRSMVGGDQYEEAGVRPQVSDPKGFSGKVFVAGAKGFVGGAVCQELLKIGAQVVGMSRTGGPQLEERWQSQVEWIRGNPLDPTTYKSAMSECEAVVSCIGGFGATDAYLSLVNGDTNVKLAQTAKECGVERFVFVSVHAYKQLPRFIKQIGYFSGKRRAEAVIGQTFGSDGYVLQPAFIYEEKKVELQNPVTMDTKSVTLPLDLVGRPAAQITSLQLVKNLAKSGLPFSEVALTQPLSVHQVAYAAARCAAGTLTGGITQRTDTSQVVGTTESANVLTIEEIKRIQPK